MEGTLFEPISGNISEEIEIGTGTPALAQVSSPTAF